LQERLLVLLAGVEPAWTLSGGGALVGFHTFHRETRVVDLVADPVPLAEPPRQTEVQGVVIQVDTPHQIFVNKLCALLSRSELRDLVDVRALLDKGCDLERGLADCPRQDAGFSPLTFAWAVRGLAVGRLGGALSWPPDEVDAIARFRDDLVDRVLAYARPDE
jgi:hypothetical protein